MREPVIPQLAAREFLGWEASQDEKFELHRGFVMAFAGGTVDHDTIAFNLRIAFDRLFPPPCRTFGSDVKVRVSADTFYYADAGVVCEVVVLARTISSRSERLIGRSRRSSHMSSFMPTCDAAKSMSAVAMVHGERKLTTMTKFSSMVAAFP